MKPHPILSFLAVLLLFTTTGHGFVTLGWKVPLDLPVPDGAKNPLVKKREHPPGPSAFLQAGDELLDLSEFVARRNQEQRQAFYMDSQNLPPSQCDWIVWNARSGIVVAQGTWDTLLEAEQALGFGDLSAPGDLKARVTFELASLDGSAKRSLTVVAVNDQSAEGEANGMKAEITPRRDSQGFSTLDVSLSWPEGESRWSATSYFSLSEGSPQRFAQVGGTHPCRITASIEWLLADGTPLREARLMEKDGAIVPRHLGMADDWLVRQTLDDGRILVISPQDIPMASYPGSLLSPAYPQMAVPPSLSGLIGPGLIDVARLLGEQRGIPEAERDFLAAIDPRTFHCFLVASEATLASIEKPVTDSFRHSPEQLWIATNPRAGGWGIIVSSGEKAFISRSTAGKEDRRFDIEPTVAGDQSLIDLRCAMNLGASGDDPGWLDTLVNLLPGHPLRIASIGEEDLEITAEIVAPPGGH